MGYHRAGFDVVGVDIEPQPRYPFEFVQHDAMELLNDVADYGEDVLHDSFGHVGAIHASPPCQDHMQTPHRKHGTGWMLPATRERLLEQTTPWVIENVPGAPMRADYDLCGCLFGLNLPGGDGQLVRERWFETSWQGFEMRSPCRHFGPAISVVGHGTPTWVRSKLGRNPTIAEYRALMGIDWMNRNELSQAIPPAYTEYIGGRMLWQLSGAGVSA